MSIYVSEITNITQRKYILSLNSLKELIQQTVKLFCEIVKFNGVPLLKKNY